MPTPDVAKLAREYLALIDASNSVVCAANARMAAAPNDLTVFTSAYKEFAAKDRSLADSLRARTFPEPIQAHVDQMIVNLAATGAAYVAVAASTSWAEVDAHLPRAMDANADAVASSNLLRGDFGLPSVAGSC